jgi:F0F1-type ATP synthase assembly protein I
VGENREEGENRRAFFVVSDAVLGAAVLVWVGVYGGAWLDTKLHTAPWLSVGLSMLGGGLGLTRMVAKAFALETRAGRVKSSKPTPGSASQGGKESTDTENSDRDAGRS